MATPILLRRKTGAWALGISLLLHLGLFGWLGVKRGEPSVPRPEVTEAVVVELVINETEPAPQPAPVRPPKRALRHVREKTRSSSGHRSGKVESPTNEGTMADPSGLLDDVPRAPAALVLVPTAPEAGPGVVVAAPRPLTAAEQEAETAARVGQRLEQWVGSVQAGRRVQNGIVDDYYVDYGQAWEGKLRDGPLFGRSGTPNAAQSFIRGWLRGAEAYGSGRAGETVGWGEALRQGASGQVDGTRLVVIVELRQAVGDGHIEERRVLQTSGNRAFDSWVLEKSGLLLSLGPPPPPPWRQSSPSVLTTWEVEGRVSYVHRRKMSELVKSPLGIPVLVGNALIGAGFDETKGEVDVIDPTEPHFVARVRLLGVN